MSVAKSLVLSQELAALLEQDTIEPVEWHKRLDGDYSVYLKTFLKVLPF